VEVRKGNGWRRGSDGGEWRRGKRLNAGVISVMKKGGRKKKDETTYSSVGSQVPTGYFGSLANAINFLILASLNLPNLISLSMSMNSAQSSCPPLVSFTLF
jgi:hypothetical protein